MCLRVLLLVFLAGSQFENLPHFNYIIRAGYERVYGKPGTPEQPGSAGTDKFLRLGSHASSNNTNYQIREAAV